jgi:hypothetical protein
LNAAALPAAATPVSELSASGVGLTSPAAPGIAGQRSESEQLRSPRRRRRTMVPAGTIPIRPATEASAGRPAKPSSAPASIV